MSIQAGIWNFDDEPVASELVARLSQLSKDCGPNGEEKWSDGPIAMLYQPFHTTRESWLERQPVHSDAGYVLTWDGRLDNREELVSKLMNGLRDDFTDAGIVMGAFERWGISAFAKLVGDWALGLWDSKERRVILARDFSGSRDLYYRIASRRMIWATRLEAVILSCGEQFDLCQEYVARYFAHLPNRHLTPYTSVLRVPPGSYVEIGIASQKVTEFWNFDLSTTLRCSEAEYDEGFRECFSRAVLRRLRAVGPVMSELSGGVDTGCIVSVADRLISSGVADVPRLETISYYVPNEPNWDEMPYVKVVEERRGAMGVHLDWSANLEITEFRQDTLIAQPGWTQAHLDSSQDLSRTMQSRNCRVLLSGLGGDEMTGGRPSPIPELLDLISQGRLIRLAGQLYSWSLVLRCPVPRLTRRLAHALFPRLSADSAAQDFPSWLSPTIKGIIRDLIDEEARRYSLWARYPSKVAALRTIAHVAGEYMTPPTTGILCWETRFPMLDRDFVQFLLCLPRDQLQRPGRRRALLRRAMAGIVPNEILERRRKASLEVRPQRAMITSPFFLKCPLLAGRSCLDESAYQRAGQLAALGVARASTGLLRAMNLEAWLESNLPSRILKRVDGLPGCAFTISAEVLGKS